MCTCGTGMRTVGALNCAPAGADPPMQKAAKSRPESVRPTTQRSLLEFLRIAEPLN
jgi:hypothetical protein